MLHINGPLIKVSVGAIKGEFYIKTVYQTHRIALNENLGKKKNSCPTFLQDSMTQTNAWVFFLRFHELSLTHDSQS